MINFFEDKVICEKDNPKFVAMITCLKQLLYITKHLFYSYEDVSISKDVFNKFFVDYFPKDNDPVSEKNMFAGKQAEPFNKIYTAIYNMWEKIEDGSVVYEGKAKSEVTKEEFKVFIKNSLTELEKF